MKLFKQTISIFIVALTLVSCKPTYEEGTFGYDVTAIKNHLTPVILKNEFAQVAVLGEWQGRVLTSTSRGYKGRSYGWINHDLVSSKIQADNYSGIGGECRLWFGPEAGKYALFFEPGIKQNHDNVRVPDDMQHEKFELIDKNDTSVSYRASLHFTNYSQNNFDIDVVRNIKLFTTYELKKYLVIAFQNKVSCVGYKVHTTMTNVGDEDWSTEKGLISLWDISTFPPTPNTTVVVPLRNTPDTVVRYYSRPGMDRMRINDSVLYYKGDGQFMNKIGVLSKHAKSVLGSYSHETGVLTIIKYKMNDDSLYVNSHWWQQPNPYEGDAINVFNDGKMGDVGPFGPFYEMETSSSARELKVGESHTHEHAVFHFEGDTETLNKISHRLLGVKLGQIVGAL